MSTSHDGPASPLFTPLAIHGNTTMARLAKDGRFSEHLRTQVKHAITGQCTCWGIPFEVKRVVSAVDKTVTIPVPVTTPWLVFLHTSDRELISMNTSGIDTAPHGQMALGIEAAEYVFCYEDGKEVSVPIRWRHQIGMITRVWGENCFQAQAHCKPYPIHPLSEQPFDKAEWGWTQTRIMQPDAGAWMNWVWAWENPRPNSPLAALRITPRAGKVILSGLAYGSVVSQPLRWERRRKAILKLPAGTKYKKALESEGRSKHVQLDMGQVISVSPRPVYPNETWARTYNDQIPPISDDEVLIEYTAHPDAHFHFEDGAMVPVRHVEQAPKSGPLTVVTPATQRVHLTVIEKGSGKKVPVRLHVHGQAGEYLPPVDRHRIPNPLWFEDYSCDFFSDGKHACTYISGETTIDLPVGDVFVEVSKGFEIRPVRKVCKVTKTTTTITLTVEKVLGWRERGWVTADTHVHFLSPRTAQLEGEAEGVNVVNLLASQWGELMTNVGDFDGKTTYGSKEAGGSGEWLVRVGTENRQHVLGHISLIGYQGGIIAPMTTGGPDESALGDPVENLLMEWARLCRDQGGLVVIPHFPQPRAEHAASLIEGLVDGVEMTSANYRFGGINPYSLSDWYRYLNCGYFVPAVGGTDKMSASMLLGALRTYAKLPKTRTFDYASWMDAVRSGNTFVTFGPLMEFSVGSKSPGSRIALKRSGGTLDIAFDVASVTVPMSRVDLIVNGEIRESRKVRAHEDAGHWSVKVDRSSWLALLVRGRHTDMPEYIAAHSSPVMVFVEGTPFYSAADAMTILDQLEGAMAFLSTLATPTEAKAYKRMRMALEAAYRKLHNRMHVEGHDHPHTHVTDHREHH